MTFFKKLKRPDRMTQAQLPIGIAYGWHMFTYGADPNNPNFVRGFEGSSLALIPSRDLFKLPSGTELITTKGELFVVGEADLDEALEIKAQERHGYLPIGFSIVGRPRYLHKPVITCLKCVQNSLVRQEVEGGYNGRRWDRVICYRCDMWWEEPYAGPDQTDALRLEVLGTYSDTPQETRALIVSQFSIAVAGK